MAKFIFYLSVSMVLYIYIGYPVIVTLLAAVKKNKIKKKHALKKVSIIISAYNEEKYIESTIKNKFESKYPQELIEIIIVSDGSTDNTDEIISRIKDNRIKFIRQEPRAGKTAALNIAVKQATGEILIFSDANSYFEENAIAELIKNFNDDSVGYVTGKMVYKNSDGNVIGDGCSAYMKYENYLRKMESSFGSIVGVNGGIDATKRNLYDPMNADQLPDFILPLNVVQKGYRVIYEPDAVLMEASLDNSKDEYRMRVRVALRAMWALFDKRNLLSLRQFKIFSWQLWSHKVLRYLCFIFLVTAYISNLQILRESIYFKIVFIAQNLIYLSGIMQPIIRRNIKNIKLLDLIHYFIVLNVASAHAFIKFISNKKQIIWVPRKGA